MIDASKSTFLSPWLNCTGNGKNSNVGSEILEQCALTTGATSLSGVDDTKMTDVETMAVMNATITATIDDLVQEAPTETVTMKEDAVAAVTMTVTEVEDNKRI